ncbi:MAG: cyclic pyranopterin monophosphate synthase MoaC [Candidatus Hydrogenedentes bacterium]|nr:cyclic pyranopterin monophosphate synthase MoaC [Candidatus Hydrogenedentota bacterium]
MNPVMLSHLNEDNQPRMVDVGEKPVTRRSARARSIVSLPQEVSSLFVDGELQTKKGPVIQTAIIAGIMAAKKTSELIPLCHPIGLDNCEVTIILNDDRDLVIECTATVHHKTGVEMEALTGASVAALTVYDMCKALSHNIVIRETRLLEKRGGKSDYRV